MKKLLLTISALAILNGCASTQTKVVETEYHDLNKDVVVLELKEVSSAIKEAMLILSRNDNALKSEVLTAEEIRQANHNATYTPSGMEREIDFIWNGYSTLALKALAELVDYEFRLGGVKPVAMMEPVVFLDEKDISVADLIRLIESQNKDQIEINLYESQTRRILEVNYVR